MWSRAIFVTAPERLFVQQLRPKVRTILFRHTDSPVLIFIGFFSNSIRKPANAKDPLGGKKLSKGMSAKFYVKRQNLRQHSSTLVGAPPGMKGKMAQKFKPQTAMVFNFAKWWMYIGFIVQNLFLTPLAGDLDGAGGCEGPCDHLRRIPPPPGGRGQDGGVVYGSLSLPGIRSFALVQ